MSEVGTPPLPDLVGWRAEDALALLAELGFRVSTAETGPPRPAGAPGGSRRVIRQRLREDGEVSLLLAWERYGSRNCPLP